MEAGNEQGFHEIISRFGRSIYTTLNEINADLNFNYNFHQSDLPKPAILLGTNNRSVG